MAAVPPFLYALAVVIEEERGWAPLAARLAADSATWLRRWIEAYERSPVRLPHPVDREELGSLFRPVLEGLAEAASPGPHPGARAELVAGSAATRELEKSMTFAAAALGARGHSAFDVSAAVFALRDVLLPLTGGSARDEFLWFCEWLAALGADALATSRERALRECYQSELEEGTPLVFLSAEIPALFAVGRPEAAALQTIFARLLLAAVRVGARSVLLDMSGYQGDFEGPFAAALERFLRHGRVAEKLAVFAVAVAPAEAPLWEELSARLGAALTLHDSFEAAFRAARARLPLGRS